MYSYARKSIENYGMKKYQIYCTVGAPLVFQHVSLAFLCLSFSLFLSATFQNVVILSEGL